MTDVDPAAWEPTVLTPYRYASQIDIGEEGFVRVIADCDHTIIEANDGRAYLLHGEVRAVISLLEQSLILTARYNQGEPDMIEGRPWRDWRNDALGRSR